MALTYKEAWNAKPDGRRREQIFQTIVEGVKAQSGGRLTEMEAHLAACNLIAFCRELIGLKQEETIGNLDSIIHPAMVDGEHE